MWGRIDQNFDRFWRELLLIILIKLRERRAIMWFSPIMTTLCREESGHCYCQSPDGSRSGLVKTR